MKYTMFVFTTILLMVTVGFAHDHGEGDGVFPEVIFQTSTEVDNVPGNYRLVTLVLGFPPGAWTPWHYHGGDGLVTVLEGEMTLELAGQEPQRYAPGEQWREYIGMPHRAGNETDEPARLVVTFILAEGAPATVALDIPSE
jgi:quercetin dioxygenase-like cupin family protein